MDIFDRTDGGLQHIPQLGLCDVVRDQVPVVHCWQEFLCDFAPLGASHQEASVLSRVKYWPGNREIHISIFLKILIQPPLAPLYVRYSVGVQSSKTWILFLRS